MKKNINICLIFLITVFVYGQKSMFDKLTIIGEHEDLHSIINIGNSIIETLVTNDYELLSHYCFEEIRFSQALGFSIETDTSINKKYISVAGKSNKKFPFYFFQPDKFIDYELKDILESYKPNSEKLEAVVINGLIKNKEVEKKYLSDLAKIFGECVSLEYYSGPSDLQIDWECTILILKKVGLTYRLVGISQDYWQP